MIKGKENITFVIGARTILGQWHTAIMRLNPIRGIYRIIIILCSLVLVNVCDKPNHIEGTDLLLRV
jgi:hypothetical protein